MAKKKSKSKTKDDENLSAMFNTIDLSPNSIEKSIRIAKVYVERRADIEKYSMNYIYTQFVVNNVF